MLSDVRWTLALINRLQLLKSGQANSSPMMKFNLKDFKSHFHYQAK